MHPRQARSWEVLHSIAYRMERRLRRVFTQDALDGMDCEDVRLAYGDWIGNDRWTRRFDRVMRFGAGVGVE